MKYSLYILCIFSFIATPTYAAVSTESLFADYWKGKAGGEKIRVLVVPGHNNESSGTAFKGLKEVEVNRILASELYSYLALDGSFEVFTTQDMQDYTEEFQTYYKKERKAIIRFRDSHIRAMKRAIQKGDVDTYENIAHNTASEDVSISLYGINKWANENEIDLVLHIHFNDYPERPWNGVGEYEGFTIYVPEKQLGNAAASKPIADSIFAELVKFNPVSDLPGEAGGVTEDQQLIAIGSHNTLDAASMLIEYGYIYEPQVDSALLRPLAMKDYAYRTYLGVKSFFEPGYSSKIAFPSALASYTFTKDLKKGIKDDLDVFALQTVLAQEGVYPGSGNTFHDCPISGNFGPCTETALKAFQKKHTITQTGTVGPLTRKVLNGQ